MKAGADHDGRCPWPARDSAARSACLAVERAQKPHIRRFALENIPAVRFCARLWQIPQVAVGERERPAQPRPFCARCRSIESGADR